MVQPKTAPISIRLSPTQLERLATYALTRTLTRHAAILDLIDRGLAPDPVETDRKLAMGAGLGQRIVAAGGRDKLTRPAVAYGSRLKKK